MPAELEHTGEGPVIVQVGLVSIVTVRELAVEQPRSVTVSVTVKVPEVPAVTETEAPVIGPTMVPLPEIDQL